MRIYDGDFTVGRLKESCSIARRASAPPTAGARSAYVIDLVKLNAKLAELPVQEIRQRRARLNIFYQEVLHSADADRGIAFTPLLMILAHYKVTNDDKSLRLEEFLRRRARLQRIDEDVRRAIVSSFFDTIFWKRWRVRKLAERRASRMESVPQLQVPEIYVEDEDDAENKSPSTTPRSSRPALSLKIPSVNIFRPHDDAAATTTTTTRTTMRHRSDSMQVSPTAGADRQLSPQRRPSFSNFGRHSSEGAVTTGSAPVSPMLEVFPPPGDADARDRSGSGSTTASAQQDMRHVLDNSAWGVSLRRSFTGKRRQS